jgi:hypothetical protein
MCGPEIHRIYEGVAVLYRFKPLQVPATTRNWNAMIAIMRILKGQAMNKGRGLHEDAACKPRNPSCG